MRQSKGGAFKTYVGILVLSAMAATVLIFLSCGGSNSQLSIAPGSTNQSPPPPPNGTSTVTTSLGDPPTCMTPNGNFRHVFVTIAEVDANIISTAGPNDSGWVTLVDLNKNPQQIDLLSLQSTTCLLTKLGSTTGLPPGAYQQIRLVLLNFSGNGIITPAVNQCGGNNLNCVVLTDGSVHPLELPAASKSFVTVPPSAIAGGSITLASNAAADIHIEFDACDSIVPGGAGTYGFKPTLHAGEISINTNAISGRVIDSTTKKPIANAKVFVEQAGSTQAGATNVDGVYTEEVTAADGTFIFCPLPSGSYDVVAAANVPENGGPSLTYNPSVLFKVPVGVAVGDIPLVPETGGSSNTGATLAGMVTSSGNANNGVSVNLAVSALQQASPTGGPVTMVSVPAWGVTSMSTTTAPNCPTGSYCVNYSLLVPASNPSVATYSPSGFAFAPPGAGNVMYTLDSRAFQLGSTQQDCVPSDLSTNQDSGGGPLMVSPGQTTTAKTLSFTSCQ